MHSQTIGQQTMSQPSLGPQTIRKTMALWGLLMCLSGLCTPVQAVTPAVASGEAHSVALAEDGSLFAWGSDSSGQLGLNRTLFRAQGKPVDLPAGSLASAFAAGARHSLGLTADGTVYAWGDNARGQLGDGTTVSRSQPRQVLLAGKATAVSAGNEMSAALLSDGSVWAWGFNNFNALGTANDEDSALPVAVTGLPPVIRIASGIAHTLALDAEGQIWSWGRKSDGQLGREDEFGSRGAGRVALPVKARNIFAAGHQSFAVDVNGRVWAWGDNFRYELGDGTDQSRSRPVLLADIDQVLTLAAGPDRTVAVRQDGSVWLWGMGDFRKPTLLKDAPTPAVAASVGPEQVLVVRSDGSVWGLGLNDFGELGDGSTREAFSFVQAIGLPAQAALGSGRQHTLGLSREGVLWAWGSNQLGQLGEALALERNIPAALPRFGEVLQVVAGDQHTLALTREGSVWAWGNNSRGAVGDATPLNRSSPVKLSGLPTIRRIGAGGQSSAAVATDGSVWVWGDNSLGQLGVAFENQGFTARPQKMLGLSGIQDVAVGGSFMLALQEDGTLQAWGDNSQGVLGVGDQNRRIGPVPVSGLTNVKAVAAGGRHALALRVDGRVWAWGDGRNAALGNQESENIQPLPQRIRGLLDVKQIAAGRFVSAALNQSGKISLWGSNDDFQLGTDTGSFSFSRTPLQAVGDNFAFVSPGARHVMTTKSDATVWGFGHNGNGQLGEGTFRRQRQQTGVANPALTAFLDLAPSQIKLTLAPADRPAFLVQTIRLGGLRNLSLNTIIGLGSALNPLQLNPPPLNPLQANPLQATRAVGAIPLLQPLGGTADGALAASGFNVYVAALVPDLRVPVASRSASLFIKSRLEGWQPYLGGPLAEFLRGVSESSERKIAVDVLSNSDVSTFAGADILIGYGTDGEEMLRAGRYRTVFTVPLME